MSVEKLRWIDYSRRSMQRVGFLKLVTSLASTSRPQSLEALTKTFAAAVTKTVPIPQDKQDQFQQYVRQLHARYPGEVTTAQIQDLYLSDPQLPSSSGAITGDIKQSGYRHAVYVEIPTWAVRLRLIREQNYTLTDRGRILSMFDRENTKKFTQLHDDNPLILSVPERFIALFCFLDADGDFLKELYTALSDRKTFSRTDAGEESLQALTRLRAGRIANANANRQIRVRIDQAIDSIKKQPSSGLGPKESIATPRIEPFVDFGILQKQQTDAYQYNFTPWGMEFAAALSSANLVDDFIENNLTELMSRSSGQRVSLNPPTIQFVAQAYSVLRSGLGYVSLRELALASIGQALATSNSELFELSSIEKMLKEAAGKSSADVRLAIGRGGGIAQIRINHRAFDPHESLR